MGRAMRPIEIGTKFGRWTIVEYVGNSCYKCICECGFERGVKSAILKRGESMGCKACAYARPRKLPRAFKKWILTEDESDNQ
jgi:hypothetical protein